METCFALQPATVAGLAAANGLAATPYYDIDVKEEAYEATSTMTLLLLLLLSLCTAALF